MTFTFEYHGLNKLLLRKNGCFSPFRKNEFRLMKNLMNNF